MTKDILNPHEKIDSDFEELSEKQVESILYQLEQKNLVFKTWDIRKQDYVWHMTESGDKLGKIISDNLGLK